MAKKKNYRVPDFVELTHMLNESGWFGKPLDPAEVKVKCENQVGRKALCMFVMPTVKDAVNLKSHLRRWHTLHIFNNGMFPFRIDIEVKYNREFTTVA
jgi:hypothetical protein